MGWNLYKYARCKRIQKYKYDAFGPFLVYSTQHFVAITGESINLSWCTNFFRPFQFTILLVFFLWNRSGIRKIFAWERQYLCQLHYLVIFTCMLQFDILSEKVDKVRPNRPAKPLPVLKPIRPPVDPTPSVVPEDVPSTSA